MACMYPEVIDPAAPASERKVFAWLQALPKRYSVFHSRRMFLPGQKNERPTEREIDFVVLDPRRGYLCLEVKGGRVRCKDGAWTTTCRDGREHPIRDPGRQSQTSAHSIARHLRKHRIEISRGWGVVFPDGVAQTGTVALPRAIVVDQSDVKAIEKAIDRVFGTHLSKPVRPDPATIARFHRIMAPAFQLVQSLAARLDEERPRLLALTDEQLRVLEIIPSMRRVGVQGTAGSGKTLLAVERARQWASDGASALFLCFNRPLADHVAARADGFEAYGFHGFCAEMCRRAGIPWPAAPTQNFWDQEAAELLQRALDARTEDRWDAIVVDEGQDFREEWWIPILGALREPAWSPLWVFHDPNQNIYGGGPVDTLDLEPVHLARNCRNTKRIATFANACIGRCPDTFPHAPEGVDVRLRTCADSDEMLAAVHEEVARLVRHEGIPLRQVAVLTPWSGKRSRLHGERALGGFPVGRNPAQRDGEHLLVSSLHRFKGLESDAVILAEIDESSGACSPKHMYVGTSRARLLLVVLRYKEPLR